jgi:FkbH-like protein
MHSPGKSAAIERLGQKLGLGLDSFVFVDDSSAECAEVATALPMVAVVQLPRGDSCALPGFLANCWVFDGKLGAAASSTEEDGARTALYRDVASRSASRDSFAGTLPAWIASLCITTDFWPLCTADVARAAQLTQRTSQMNVAKHP